MHLSKIFYSFEENDILVKIGEEGGVYFCFLEIGIKERMRKVAMISEPSHNEGIISRLSDDFEDTLEFKLLIMCSNYLDFNDQQILSICQNDISLTETRAFRVNFPF